MRIGLVISCDGHDASRSALALSPYWTPLTLFLPLVLNAIGNGMTIPGSTAAALSARPELAGSAAGLMGALQLGAGALRHDADQLAGDALAAVAGRADVGADLHRAVCVALRRPKKQQLNQGMIAAEILCCTRAIV